MPRRLTNPRRQASLHADAALNHIHTSTTTASSLAPRIHSTVAMSKSNTPTRASGRFSKFPSFQGLKRASISSKTSQTLFKVYRVLKGFKVLRVSRAKGSHLRVSTLVHTPIYRLLLAAMLDHVTTGNDGRVRTGCTARVRAQLDGWPLSPLTPQSLTTPQPQHRLQIA